MNIPDEGNEIVYEDSPLLGENDENDPDMVFGGDNEDKIDESDGEDSFEFDRAADMKEFNDIDLDEV